MARTRDQIAEAALHLFLERGYDATTLEEVADRAEVHKRTLLRYFPSKSHLVLHGYHSSLEQFRTQMEARGDTPTVEVWQAHVESSARRMARRGPLANVRKIARTEPALEGAYLSIQAKYQALVLGGLLVDLAGRENCEILARVAASALVAGNYAVGAMIFSREAYDELEDAEVQVISLVRDTLLA
ncbi:TetR/AcrR family transcriptional regulator [Phenylobacterium sp.]|uniref:TetR/AcrR family transcriptional regulator n=1 Tax=Phenylobacterium sp. TaxID=1871053 RepID=UPI0025F4005D|nr:TetR/AcrR family transcriptional regulator [Phenylobacterium sp.]MBX3484127.1 TetR family transcriptional regulator [Phenylobacterium sp.]